MKKRESGVNADYSAFYEEFEKGYNQALKDIINNLK